MYEEHRAAVACGKVVLREEDFFTELGKRIFTAIMELHASDGGFMFALLGERFTADEIGRIQRMIQARDKLTDNGTRVLCEHIERLREATRSKSEKAGLDDLLKAKRQQLQDKKTKG